MVYSSRQRTPPVTRARDRRSSLSSICSSRRFSAFSRSRSSTFLLCSKAALSSFRSASRSRSLHRRLLVNWRGVRPRWSLACRSAFRPISSCGFEWGGGWGIHHEPLSSTYYMPFFRRPGLRFSTVGPAISSIHQPCVTAPTRFARWG